MAEKRFAVVYETTSKIVRRVIDTNNDATDAILNRVRLAPDETLQFLAISQYPDRKPAAVAAALGLKMPPRAVAARQGPDLSLPTPIRNAPASLSPKCQSDFLARVAVLEAGGFKTLPRNDPVAREILAAEYAKVGQASLAAELRNANSPAAPYYVRMIYQAILTAQRS